MSYKHLYKHTDGRCGFLNCVSGGGSNQECGTDAISSWRVTSEILKLSGTCVTLSAYTVQLKDKVRVKVPGVDTYMYLLNY